MGPLWASVAWWPRTTTLRLEVKQYKLKCVKTEKWSEEDVPEEESSDDDEDKDGEDEDD